MATVMRASRSKSAASDDLPTAGVNASSETTESDRRPVATRSTHPSGDACWRAGERGAAADHRSD